MALQCVFFTADKIGYRATGIDRGNLASPGPGISCLGKSFVDQLAIGFLVAFPPGGLDLSTLNQKASTYPDKPGFPTSSTKRASIYPGKPGFPTNTLKTAGGLERGVCWWACSELRHQQRRAHAGHGASAERPGRETRWF